MGISMKFTLFFLTLIFFIILAKGLLAMIFLKSILLDEQR